MKKVSELNIYGYYEALNNFIEQYGYLRNIFWIHKLDENI